MSAWRPWRRIFDREHERMWELVREHPDLGVFQDRVLDLVNRMIGFDKAVLNGFHEKRGEDIHSWNYDAPPTLGQGPQYVEEFESQELEAACRPGFVDTEVLSRSRRKQLSVYSHCMWPERVTVFTLFIWRTEKGIYGINLARTGRGARFSSRELIKLDELISKVIKPCDDIVRLAVSLRAISSPIAWVDEFGITAKEQAVAELVARGLRNGEIAKLLGVSPLTVRNHLSSIYRKMNVSTRAELAFIISSLGSSEFLQVELLPWMKHVP